MRRSARHPNSRAGLVLRRSAGRMVLTAVVILLAACATPDADPSPQSDSADTPTPSASAPVDLAAELIASRRDQASGQVRIRLTNLGTAAVPIDTIRLVAPPYSPEPARINTRELRPGQTVAYPVVHGEPECAGEAPTPGPVSVEIDTVDQHLSVVPTDTTNVIDRMLAVACGRQRLAELVTIRLDTEWVWSDGAAEQTGTLTISRRADGPPITLTGVRGGINYTLELLDPASPLTLGTGDDELTVPVRSRAARCEPHALADNSKPYGFNAWLTLDGGPEIHVEFSAADQPENLDRLCGIG